MKTPESFRHLRIAIVWVLSVLVLGTMGYMFIEQLSFVDALYTTVGMMATIGNLVQPLSVAGRLFSIAVVILGVGALLYTLGVVMEFVIEGHMSQAIKRYFMDNKIASLRNHYIICGFGRVGIQIAEELAAAQVPFVVIDGQESNVQECFQRGYLVLQGDATSDELLGKAGIRHAKCILIATDDDAHNIYITLSARHLNHSLFIVARANHDGTEAKLKLAGANRVLSPYRFGGHRMANLALRPGVVDFFDLVTRSGNMELAAQEVLLAATSPLIGKTMMDVQEMLSDDTMIVAVKKKGGLVKGLHKVVRLERGDSVIVVGDPRQLTAFAQENAAS
jgi:voltage-gated potassium channel